MRQRVAFGLDRGHVTAAAVYTAMILGSIAGFILIAELGDGLTAPAKVAAEASSASLSTSPSLLKLLLALAAVIVSCRAAGMLFRRLHQPPVIGEVIAGILLGPSLLGAIAPGASAWLFPDTVMPLLNIVAQLGVLFYMFMVGLEFDAAVLHRRGHVATAISHASIIAPFLLGATLALVLYGRLSHDGVPFVVFALFLGVSMSVTAFPVLARILTDRNMHRTPLGAIALACAAVDDVTAWCLLALVVGVAQARTDTAVWAAILTAAYVLGMFLLVRPLLQRLLAGRSSAPTGTLAAVLVGLLVSAAVTEAIGIHAIFGAFLLGAVIPHDSPLARDVRAKLEPIVTIVLLPAFFALAGMRTEMNLLGGWENWMLCGAILLVAIVGKFGGSAVAARCCGMSWRESAAIGALMNTRGLMELVVLNIGLDAGVIEPRLYSLMVVMAVVTTLLTTPVLYFLGVGGEGDVSARLSPQRLLPVASGELISRTTA
jgi:Kef-type K+ transport system membrane component KefB